MYKTEYIEGRDEIGIEFRGENKVLVFSPPKFNEEEIRILLMALTPMIKSNLLTINSLKSLQRGFTRLSRVFGKNPVPGMSLSDSWHKVPVSAEDAELIIAGEKIKNPAFVKSEQKGLFSFGNVAEPEKGDKENNSQRSHNDSSDPNPAEMRLNEIFERYTLKTIDERLNDAKEEKRKENAKMMPDNYDGADSSLFSSGTIHIADAEIQVTVRCGTGHKNIGIEIKKGPEILITAPAGVIEEDITGFLKANKDWISEKFILLKYAGIESRTDGCIEYDGVTYSYTVRYSRKVKGFEFKTLKGGIIEVTSPRYTKTDDIEAAVLDHISNIHEHLRGSGKNPDEDIDFRKLHEGLFKVSGREIPYIVKYNSRLRSAGVEIKEGPKLVVNVPSGVGRDFISGTLEMNAEWIYDNYQLVEKAGVNGRSEHTLTYNGEIYSYTVRYLKRSKNIRINIKEGGIIEVSAPLHADVQEVERIVSESAPEIHEKIGRLKAFTAGNLGNIPEPKVEMPSYEPGTCEGTFRVSGRDIPFTVEYGSRFRKVRIKIRNGPKLIVTAPFGAEEKEIYSVLKYNRQWIAENYPLVEKAGVDSRTDHTITYNGETYSYTVKYSKRAKKFSIKILEDDTVEVIVPFSAAPEDVEKMVTDNAAFIHKTISNEERKTAKRIGFYNGAPFYIKGKKVKIRAVKSHKMRKPELKKGYLTVTIPKDAIDENYCIEQEVTEYMQDLTRQEVRKYLPKYSKIFGISVPDIEICYSKSFWGQCKPGINLVKFNERLAMVSGHLTEYIVAHELCHYHHPNHSKRFYSTLREAMPESDMRKEEMKNYRIELLKEH
ncbi:M48 family metallopeptidase [Methanoplanus endosymbiosus]|uniref:M48 family metallopeptidase n=1 Tax=Methanoplanus endosymbiosus TaxID=33865 RepID=A0A9E7THM8_9EURY|nr:M48 family metallopeptidase [Methanoplanus endosymbiosus]UUX93252.1 M48 family metallopeptidase [Methanoplanus endosymbiosus]